MMWLTKRGLIAKIKDDCCIIITSKGTYERIPVPAQGARVGAEVTYHHPILSFNNISFNSFNNAKPMMLVASFLILFVGYTLFRQPSLPVAMAYVSLDINPSLEMSVDKDLRVINVTCFNDDAANLVKQERFRGKNIYEALQLVIDKAIEQNYIKAGQENLIISTVTSVASPDTGTTPIDQKAVRQSLQQPVDSGGLKGEVKTYSVTGEFRHVAEKNGLSPGKFLIYEQVITTGNKVSIDEVRKDNIHNLVDHYRIDLLPNYRNIRIKSHQIQEQPEVLVETHGTAVPISVFSKRDNGDGNNSDHREACPKNNEDRPTTTIRKPNNEQGRNKGEHNSWSSWSSNANTPGHNEQGRNGEEDNSWSSNYNIPKQSEQGRNKGEDNRDYQENREAPWKEGRDR